MPVILPKRRLVYHRGGRPLLARSGSYVQNLLQIALTKLPSGVPGMVGAETSIARGAGHAELHSGGLVRWL